MTRRLAAAREASNAGLLDFGGGDEVGAGFDERLDLLALGVGERGNYGESRGRDAPCDSGRLADYWTRGRHERSSDNT